MIDDTDFHGFNKAPQKPENPMAFPFEGGTNNGIQPGGGMSLRDYFAAAAIPTVIACSMPRDGINWQTMIPACADLSYIFADEMLKSRAK